MPDPISAVAAATQPARRTTASIGDSLDTDMFMSLLVTQLKYQDPTAPTDSTEFLAQTAQFTMVEKLSAIAEQTEANAITSRNLGAASLVGKQISWLAEDGTTRSVVVGSARLGSAGPVLTVGGRDVPFDLVSAVSGPITPPAITTPAITTPAATTPAATTSAAATAPTATTSTPTTTSSAAPSDDA